MTCEARKYIEKGMHEGSLTEKDLLNWEILIRVGCPVMKACEKVLNDILITKEQKRKDRNDPTSQE